MGEKRSWSLDHLGAVLSAQVFGSIAAIFGAEACCGAPLPVSIASIVRRVSTIMFAPGIADAVAGLRLRHTFEPFSLYWRSGRIFTS